MDTQTVRIYEAHAAEWASRRSARFLADAVEFTAAVESDAVRVDLGCGPGHYAAELGRPLIALDVARAMVDLARAKAPDVLGVRADLERLPFRPGALGGAWARNSYLHLPRAALPRALAELHHALIPDGPLMLAMKVGEHDGHDLPGDDFPGRYFALWDADRLATVVSGAGFEISDCTVEDTTIHVRATRARTLPDFVGPDLHVLVCGLNPSLRSADVGFGYAGASNRFWPAALDAGLVTKTRDPWWLLDHDRVGMTDLVKRATVGAKELRLADYRAGVGRVEQLAAWLRPRVVCFVGLTGYRAAVDRGASSGLQAAPFGGTAAYVLPSTSGLNARTSRAELTEHLRAVAAIANT